MSEVCPKCRRVDYLPVTKLNMTVPQLLVLDAIRSLDGIPFVKLRDQLDLTDGNLFSHIRKLERLGFLTIKRRFIGNIPQTSYSATKEGRGYVEFVQALLTLKPATAGRNTFCLGIASLLDTVNPV